VNPDGIKLLRGSVLCDADVGEIDTDVVR